MPVSRILFQAWDDAGQLVKVVEMRSSDGSVSFEENHRADVGGRFVTEVRASTRSYAPEFVALGANDGRSVDAMIADMERDGTVVTSVKLGIRKQGIRADVEISMPPRGEG